MYTPTKVKTVQYCTHVWIIFIFQSSFTTQPAVFDIKFIMSLVL